MIDPNGFMQRPGPAITAGDRAIVRSMAEQWASRQPDGPEALAAVLAAFGDVLDD